MNHRVRLATSIGVSAFIAGSLMALLPTFQKEKVVYAAALNDKVNGLPGMPPVTDAGNLYAADAPGMLNPVVKKFPSLVYVPNTKSDTVDIIDPVSYKIVGHFALPKPRKGHLEPQHVVPSWDLKKLWVA